MEFTLQVVCWFALFLHGSVAHFCPVSKHYDSKQQFHRYPVSVYYPMTLPQMANAYNCSISQHNQSIHSTMTVSAACDRNVTLCPVNEENIRSATSVATWPQYADAIKYIGKTTSMNVFYLGGSMTAGAETLTRCRCRDAEDSRCSAFSLAPHRNSSYCSWPSHLTRWLNHTYPATSFHFHDYSIGGRGSKSSAYLIHMLHNSKANLSNPALFFLDFSVNDVLTNTSAALESLMHTIYNNFGRHYHVRPTVILLEQYPHRIGPPLEDYVPIYRLLAERYSLILISLYEVFQTYFGLPQDRNITNPDLSKQYYPISPNDYNVHMHIHPPWYVHLFIADVVAECIKRIAEPFKSKSHAKANTIHHLHDRALVPTVSYVPPSPLPKPLFDHSVELQQVCNISIPFILSKTPRAINVPANKLNWQKGWIEHVSHSVPGWEINSHSEPSNRVLSFPLNGDPLHFQGAIALVSYLKSYEGMGAVTVSVCGAPLSNNPIIDGLWSFPVSLPWPVSFVLQTSDVARCQSLAPHERLLSMEYFPGPEQKVRVKHDHLFKVFNVQVCTPVQAST